MFRDIARKTTLLITLGFAILAGGAAFARPSLDTGGAFAPTGDITSKPIGWVLYCREQQADCRNTAAHDETVVLDQDKWRTLLSIDHLVNDNIIGMSDNDHYHIYSKGISNWWTYPDDGMGNCNDYVILKKRLLEETGWPASALLLTVVLDHENEGHLVLMVRTDRGDLILDNLTDKVVTWALTGYTFLKRQSATDPDTWVALAGERHEGHQIASLRVNIGQH